MMELTNCVIPRSANQQNQNNELLNLPQLQYKGMAHLTIINTVRQIILCTDSGMNTKRYVLTKEWDCHANEGHNDDVDGPVHQPSREAIGHPSLHQLVLYHVIHRHGIYLRSHTNESNTAAHVRHGTQSCHMPAWQIANSSRLQHQQLTVV